MKALHVVVLSLFAFHSLLFASAATEARSLLTVENSSKCGFTKAGSEGRHGRPPPPPRYSPGPTPGMHRSPLGRSPRRPSPPPSPSYSPGVGPGMLRSPPRPFTVIGSLPATSEHAPALKDFVNQKSLPNPYAASA